MEEYRTSSAVTDYDIEPEWKEYSEIILGKIMPIVGDMDGSRPLLQKFTVSHPSTTIYIHHNCDIF